MLIELFFCVFNLEDDGQQYIAEIKALTETFAHQAAIIANLQNMVEQLDMYSRYQPLIKLSALKVNFGYLMPQTQLAPWRSSCASGSEPFINFVSTMANAGHVRSLKLTFKEKWPPCDGNFTFLLYVYKSAREEINVHQNINHLSSLALVILLKK